MNASSGLVAVQSAATVYFTQREGVGAGIPAVGAALGADELGELARSITCGAEVVDAHEDADGTLHVRIARFTEDVGTAVARVLAHAPHATRVVLDLRGNPGGDLDAALALASDFLDEGTPLAIVRDADGDEELRRAHGPKRNAHSLTLWVDGGTASAAEVFTMALDASGRARVLGERTYGKASVQRTITGPDGRATYAELAELVGLSPAATRLRVQRLLDAGVVQVVGVTDPLALGYPVMAALGVRVERNVRAVADRIADIKGVIYVVFTSGSFDLLVEVLCEDSARLLQVIDDEIRSIDDVRTVESFTYFGIHTHRFVWGTR